MFRIRRPSESIKRISQAVKELGEVMNEEKRGYIFCTIPELDNKHLSIRSHLQPSQDLIVIKSDGHPCLPFVALTGVVERISEEWPEERRDELAKLFVTFVEISVEECFPKSLNVKVSMHGERR